MRDRITRLALVCLSTLLLAGCGGGSTGPDEDDPPTGDRIYVDPAYAGVEEGTEEHPYNTIEEGIAAAGRGDVVVLAAGAWSPALARPLGLRLPIQPATGYSSTLPTWPGAPRHPVFVGESRVIVLPLGDRVRFAGTLELGGFRRSGDPVRSRAVLDAGRGAFAEPPPDAPVEHWFGFRPLMPDDLPAIGRAPRVDGVIVAAGHGTLGFTQGPATGKLVAELAVGRPASIPLEPFRPNRF